MSFIDKAKEAIADTVDKAKDAIADNVDKVESAIDKAGDFIDEKTSGKFAETIDKVSSAAHRAVDRVGEHAGELYIDGDGSLLPAQGILKEMGYRVGKSGLLSHQRRENLRRTFEVQLVSTSGEATDYIAEWGGRCSQARYEKMNRVLGGLQRTLRERRSWTPSITQPTPWLAAPLPIQHRVLSLLSGVRRPMASALLMVWQPDQREGNVKIKEIGAKPRSQV